MPAPCAVQLFGCTQWNGWRACQALLLRLCSRKPAPDRDEEYDEQQNGKTNNAMGSINTALRRSWLSVRFMTACRFLHGKRKGTTKVTETPSSMISVTLCYHDMITVICQEPYLHPDRAHLFSARVFNAHDQADLIHGHVARPFEQFDGVHNFAAVCLGDLRYKTAGVHIVIRSAANPFVVRLSVLDCDF